MAIKRVNFNMEAECHALLKGVCALKRVTVSEYVYEIIAEKFAQLIKTDEQVQSMFLAGSYKPGGKAYSLKEYLIEELKQRNDSSAWSLCHDW